jgi:hypothetical protein
MNRSARARLLIVALFASAMGWLEAVVVVYIRGLLGFAHGGAVPEPDLVMARLRGIPWLVPTEQGREAATLVMLATLAWLAAPDGRGRFGAFLVAFGGWDIVYYVGLRAMLGWPESLATRDVLFLIPPSPLWYQPVWLPVAISLGMIALGARWMTRSAPPQAPATRAGHP